MSLTYATTQAHRHISGGKQSLWAVAVGKGNRVLAEAGNLYNVTPPRQARYAKAAGRELAQCLHAEIHMLTKLLRNGNSCAKVKAVYVARANKAGKPILAKPCEICTMALQAAGIDMNIVHWTE